MEIGQTAQKIFPQAILQKRMMFCPADKNLRVVCCSLEACRQIFSQGGVGVIKDKQPAQRGVGQVFDINGIYQEI